MVQSRQGHRLATELLFGLSQCLGCGVGVWTDLLDGADTPFQAQVLGAVNRPHPTLANRRNDLVPSAQDGSGLEQPGHVFSSSPQPSS